MAEALKDKPPTPFRVPPGIRLVRVDAATGKPAQPGDTRVIYEAFKPGSVPSGAEEQALDNDEPMRGLPYGPLPAAGVTDGQGGPAIPKTGSEPAAPRPSAPVESAPPPAPQPGGLY
jgi:penicillin-binding protein 1A